MFALFLGLLLAPENFVLGVDAADIKLIKATFNLPIAGTVISCNNTDEVVPIRTLPLYLVHTRKVTQRYIIAHKVRKLAGPPHEGAIPSD
jgi:hypothetical protein